MFCGLNQQNYQAFEQGVDRTAKAVKDNLHRTLHQTLKTLVKEFKDLKEFFTMEYEWHGVIESVRPKEDSLPQLEDGSCYHTLTLKDGQSFDLIFPHVQFSTLEPRLQKGYALKITYRYADNNQRPRVINIYPRPYYKLTTYEDFLEEELLEEDTPIKVHYLEDQITRLDFLPAEKPKSD